MFCIFCVFSCIIVILFSSSCSSLQRETCTDNLAACADVLWHAHIICDTYVRISPVRTATRQNLYLPNMRSAVEHTRTHSPHSLGLIGFVCLPIRHIVVSRIPSFVCYLQPLHSRPSVCSPLSLLLKQVARTRRSPDATPRAAWPRSA